MGRKKCVMRMRTENCGSHIKNCFKEFRCWKQNFKSFEIQVRNFK